jgi:hypothetical protein
MAEKIDVPILELYDVLNRLSLHNLAEKTYEKLNPYKVRS